MSTSPTEKTSILPQHTPQTQSATKKPETLGEKIVYRTAFAYMAGMAGTVLCAVFADEHEVKDTAMKIFIYEWYGLAGAVVLTVLGECVKNGVKNEEQRSLLEKAAASRVQREEHEI